MPFVLGQRPTCTPKRSVTQSLRAICPGIARNEARCPACDANPYWQLIDAVIVHLNDVHRWPRFAIADWLDSLAIDLTISPEEKA